MTAIRGWWFGGDVLPHGDGRPVRVGETLTVDGPLVLCHHGLHLLERAIDALQYATTDSLWRVEVPAGVEVLRGTDKLCARSRTHVQRIDAGPLLRQFARECALDVAHLWKAPPGVRRYLETGDETLRAAARAAASAAASAAAWDAAWDAAWAAARADASAAAWAAASADAWAAASAAAWAAARAAARDAAWAAASADAWAAARVAQAQRLDEMLLTAMGGGA